MREDELRHETAEVSAENAYRAALERAARTQEALILAEAQVLEWKARYVRAMQQLAVADEDHWRPTNAGPVEFVCPHKGVDDGAQESTGYGAAVRGEADSAVPVPE